MKKTSVSLAVLALTAGAALAADLPSRKAPVLPPPPPPPLWTGFYAGLNAGGTWGNNNSIQFASVGIPQTSVDSSDTLLGAAEYALVSAAGLTGSLNGGNNGGFIGGGQIGYNYQFYNSFLIGFEADIQGVASSGSSRSALTALPLPTDNWWDPGTNLVTAVSARSNLNYLGTVRGRLGWLATPTLLIYGTGGLAYGGVSANIAFTQTNNNTDFYRNTYGPAFGGANYSNTRVGWTAGGGLEWMFFPNWSAKVEYLYYDLGSARITTATPTSFNIVEGSIHASGIWATTATAISARVNGNIVRAGVNYHFNWGAAPVVAKY